MAILITINEAAEQFGLGRSTIFRLIREGELRSYGIAGDARTYVKASELRKLRRPVERPRSTPA